MDSPRNRVSSTTVVVSGLATPTRVGVTTAETTYNAAVSSPLPAESTPLALVSNITTEVTPNSSEEKDHAPELIAYTDYDDGEEKDSGVEDNDSDKDERLVDKVIHKYQ